MKSEVVTLPWPIGLNTDDKKRAFLPDECEQNINFIRRSPMSVRAHQRWDAGGEITTEKFIHGKMATFMDRDEELIVFGTASTGGFVKKIPKGSSIVLEDLDDDYPLTGLNKYVVPCFVHYGDSMYIFMGPHNVDEWDNVVRYDGKALIETGIPWGYVATKFRDRLWFTIKGELWFTDPFTEAVGNTNFYQVGNIEEPILALIPLKDRLIIGKRYEVWELVYTTPHVYDAVLRQFPVRAGIIHHTAGRAYYNSCYCYDDLGAYLIHPERVEVDPKRMLKMANGFYKISPSIDTVFEDLQITEPHLWEAYHTQPGEWEMTMFQAYWYVTISENPATGEQGVQREDIYCDYAYFYLKPIERPTDTIFDRLYGRGWIMGDIWHDSIQMWVSKDYLTWYQVPLVFNQDHVVKWEWACPNELQEADQLWVHFKYQIDQPIHDTAFVHEVKVTCTPSRNSYFGSGIFDDRFYLFGKDRDDNRVTMAYKDGAWQRVSFANFEIYNLIDELAWDEGYNYIGMGKSLLPSPNNYGILVKKLKPESHDTMTVQGLTGELDFGNPNSPKKLRKLWLTYVCSQQATFKIYDDNGGVSEITLPAQSEFAMREFNIHTSRSKWFKFEIIAQKSDFELLMPISVLVNFLGFNEV